MSRFAKMLSGLLLAAASAVAQTGHPATPIHVPLTKEHWHALAPIPGGTKPVVAFTRQEGFPEGILALKSGATELYGLTFRDGTIEFDMKPIGEDIPGITFRVQGERFAENGEEFYVRSAPDCRASNDCIQYTPVIHGFLLWNSYPQYQTQALIFDGWNHVKLVVSGHRMNVYLNWMTTPALVVGSLESRSMEGHIVLKGPAYYANLTVTPRATEGLPSIATPDPTISDPRYLRHWQVAPLARFTAPPTNADIAKLASLNWKSTSAERFGMVNLNRQFRLSFDPPPLTWLRTTVVSDREQTKHASMGWIGQMWIFVNGRQVTEAKNLYSVEGARREPDGRLSLENGSFDIPLRRGANEIVVALVPSIHADSTPNRYGWGLEMRLENVKGIRTSQ